MDCDPVPSNVFQDNYTSTRGLIWCLVIMHFDTFTIHLLHISVLRLLKKTNISKYLVYSLSTETHFISQCWVESIAIHLWIYIDTLRVYEIYLQSFSVRK